ncbi:MAG: product, partial [Myxococcaceae bacterium]|nr:product [Myxococcaceae bacterium]
PPPPQAPVYHQPPPPPQSAPVLLTTPAAQAVPLTTPAAQAVPLTTPAAQALPLVQHGQVKPPSRKDRPLPATVFPETAAKVPLGPHGLPRVETELEAFSETNFYTNFVGDIHDHGGIFVATYAVLAVGTPCEVAVKFPGDYLAEFRGVVKWRREATRESNVDSGSQPGMGIEITEASAEVWALINRFIQKREPIIQDV